MEELSEKRQKLRLQKKLPEDDSGIELPNFSAGGQSRHDWFLLGRAPMNLVPRDCRF